MAEQLEKAGPQELLDPRGVRAQPPDAPAPLRTRPPPEVAGGLPAVVSSVRHAFGEAGLVRGARLLARLNQFEGYDCPGCAWPDPDGERGAFEFCENGAKAIAEESTKDRVTRDFFARHSVAELSRQSEIRYARSRVPSAAYKPSNASMRPARYSHINASSSSWWGSVMADG